MSITPVQSKTVFDGSSPLTATFDSNVTLGNLIVVSCGAFEQNIPVPTDGQGNTYIELGTEQTTPTTNTHSRSFYTYATATGSLTVSFAGINGSISMSEWFDLVASNPVDTAAAGAAAATTTPSAGATGTLAQANSLIYAVLISGTGLNTSITEDTVDGFTLIGEIVDNLSQQAIADQYKIVSATTSVTPDWTIGGPIEYAYHRAVFKGLSAPSAPTITNVDPGHQRAGIQWTSGSDGGSSITDWEIDVATEAAPTTWLGVQATGSSSLFGEYTGLTNGTAYVFRVRGVNALGNGVWSSTSSSVTPVDDRGVLTLESDVDDFLLESGDRLLLESGSGVVAPNEGAVTGVITITGTVTGTKTPKGSVTGVITRTGSVTGIRLPKAAITGTVTRTGSVTGEFPLIDINDGSVTGTNDYIGSVTGLRRPQGAITGTITRTGVVVGVNLGVVIGTVTRTGVVTGLRTSNGALIGTVTRTGTVTGLRTPKGAITGTITSVGVVTGTSPLVGVNDGSVIGAISRVGSVTGKRTPTGLISGTVTRIGTVLGAKHSVGFVPGTITRVGFVIGGNLGIVVGSISRIGVVQGTAPFIPLREGNVVGSISWSGSTTGSVKNQSVIIGAILWVGTVTAVLTIDPAVFLLRPHAIGYISTIMVGAKPIVAQGFKPIIVKGRSENEHYV